MAHHTLELYKQLPLPCSSVVEWYIQLWNDETCKGMVSPYMSHHVQCGNGMYYTEASLLIQADVVL